MRWKEAQPDAGLPTKFIVIEGIDVKEFGDKLLAKVLYNSSVESKDDGISIMLKNRGNDNE